jgi:hypothetical protein
MGAFLDVWIEGCEPRDLRSWVWLPLKRVGVEMSVRPSSELR